LRLRVARFLDLNLWVVPMMCMVGCVLLAILTLRVDRHYDYALIAQSLTGTPTDAQTLLTTIVSSMVTLITLVLTVMTLAVQLAMEQFSPRIVQALLRDRGNQISMGLFGGTAVYAFIAQSGIDDQKNHVPGVTVLMSYLLMLASLAVLVLYVSRSGQSLRASGLIDLVGDHFRTEVGRCPNLQGRPLPAPAQVVLSGGHGVIVAIDTDRLVRLAQGADTVLTLVPMMGDFVPGAAPLVRIHGDSTRLDHDRVRRAVLLGPERTHHDDPVFALTKLVEIAVRCARTDPGTSIQALDRIHDGLRDLVQRELHDGRYTDDEGQVRLEVRTVQWDGYVKLAFDEIIEVGAAVPKIDRRLRAALLDLASVSPPERRLELDRELEVLERAVARLDGHLAETARNADGQGFGSGGDLTHRRR
jgi:uncharacterized membrane protein